MEDKELLLRKAAQRFPVGAGTGHETINSDVWSIHNGFILNGPEGEIGRGCLLGDAEQGKLCHPFSLPEGYSVKPEEMIAGEWYVTSNVLCFFMLFKYLRLGDIDNKDVEIYYDELWASDGGHTYNDFLVSDNIIRPALSSEVEKHFPSNVDASFVPCGLGENKCNCKSDAECGYRISGEGNTFAAEMKKQDKFFDKEPKVTHTTYATLGNVCIQVGKDHELIIGSRIIGTTIKGLTYKDIPDLISCLESAAREVKS